MTKSVGLAVFGMTLAVLTTGAPVLIQGAHPANMVQTKIEENLPCVAADGIVDLGAAVAYPSHDGLVVISSSGAQIVTRSLFDRDDWSDLNPETFKAASYEGRYCFSYTTDGETQIGMLDLTSETPFMIDTTIKGRALHVAPSDNALYILDQDDGVTIHRFDAPGEDPMTMRWTSKTFYTKSLLNFGAMRIDVDDRDPSETPAYVAATLYADGKKMGTISKPNTIRRLPGGYLADRFQIEIIANAPVTYVGVAQTLGELG